MTNNHHHCWDGRRSVKVFLRQARISCFSLPCRAVDAVSLHRGTLGHSALSPKIVISSSLIICQMKSGRVHLVIDKPLKSCDLRKNAELEAKPTALCVWIQWQKHQQSAGICHDLRYYCKFLPQAPTMDISLNRRYGIAFIKSHHNRDTLHAPYSYDLNILEPQERLQWYLSWADGHL